MGKTRNNICALLLAVLFTSCPVAGEFTELPWTYPPGVTSKTGYTNGRTVKVTLSIDGTEDPRVVLRYRMGTNFGPYYFDYVVLRSAKMVKVAGTGDAFTFNLDLSEVKSILDRRSTMIAPLQSRGIKVLLQIENGGEGFTFANLPLPLIHPFAQECKNILEQYNLDGFEFNDINGDYIADDPAESLYAYPAMGRTNYYSGVFDDFPDYNPNKMGDRLTIADAVIPKDYLNYPTNNETWSLREDEKVEYFWLNGAYSYGVLLSYFRTLPEWQVPNAPNSIIGELRDKPILVRETGFASGRDDLEIAIMDELYIYFQRRNSYLAQWIEDKKRPSMDFVGITDMVDVFMSNDSAPYFGWKNTVSNQYTGKSIMTFATHDKYCPGILDLNTVTDEEIEIFSTRFANGNKDNVSDIAHGTPYILLYYTNVGDDANTAEKLSITSRIVYGGRQEEYFELIALLNNGPEVVYTTN